MRLMVHGIDGQGTKRAGENARERAPIARVRIRGGRITCTACGRLSAEVVLLEPDRPICGNCAGERPPGAGVAPGNPHAYGTDNP